MTTGISNARAIHRAFCQRIEFLAHPVLGGKFLPDPPQHVLFQKRQHVHQAGKFRLGDQHAAWCQREEIQIVLGRAGAEIQDQVVRLDGQQVPQQPTLLLVRDVGHDAATPGDKAKTIDARLDQQVLEVGGARP